MGHLERPQKNISRRPRNWSNNIPPSRMDLPDMPLVYGGMVAQAWMANVMVDETTELILTK